MASEPWARMCEGVSADSAVGLSQGEFCEILSEELQANGAPDVSRGAAKPPAVGGPMVRQRAIAALHTKTIASPGSGSGSAVGVSFILNCKDYYVEQAVRYVSTPGMDAAMAVSAVARLTELSGRVMRRLKFVFFELPSDASVQLFFEQLAMKEAYSRASQMSAAGAAGVSISLVDLCRNKILGHFQDEGAKLAAYEHVSMKSSIL